MCGMCPDVFASCDQIECGARSPVDENGKRRARWMRWFTWGEIPCKHVIERHKPGCAVAKGCECDCEDEDDE